MRFHKPDSRGVKIFFQRIFCVDLYTIAFYNVGMNIDTNFQDFVWNYKEPLVFASTIAVIAATCFEYLTLDMIRYNTAGGLMVGCTLQLLGIAVDRRGISDPKHAPIVTNLLTVMNIATWLIDPSGVGTLTFAIFSVAFKVSTVAIRSFYKE